MLISHFLLSNLSALYKMFKHTDPDPNTCYTPDTEDNVLIEWMLALLCVELGRVERVFPILIGSIDTNTGIPSDFFSTVYSKLDQLPSFVPTACVQVGCCCFCFYVDIFSYCCCCCCCFCNCCFSSHMNCVLIFKYQWMQVVQRVLQANGLPEPPELFTRTVRDTVKLVSLFLGFPISKARDQVLHDMFGFPETFCLCSFSNHTAITLPDTIHD